MKTLFVIILSALFIMGCSNNSEAPKPEKAPEPSGQSLGSEATNICAESLRGLLNNMIISPQCNQSVETKKIFSGRIFLEELSSCGTFKCLVAYGSYGDAAGVFNAAKTIAENEGTPGCCLASIEFWQISSDYPHFCGSGGPPCCDDYTEIRFEATYFCGEDDPT